MKRIRYMRRLLLLLVIILLLAGCKQVNDSPALRIGYMNCNNKEETLRRFLPLTRYMEKKLGVRLEAVPVDTQEFDERFGKEKFAFTHTNSLLYVMLKKDHALQLMAADKRGNYGSRTAGTIISRKGSGINKLEDIRGKRMGFGPQMAPTGYLAQYDLMLREGIDPEKNLAYYSIPHGSFKHEKVIYGVYFGEYDVAAAPALDLEIMVREGKISADDFNVLAQSPTIPYCTFGSAGDTDPALVKKFRQALMELTPEDTVEIDGEQVKVLKAAWVDGFEQLTDADYDPIREMAKRANMPPYQQY